MLALAMILGAYALTLVLAAACVYVPFVILTRVPNVQVVILQAAGATVAVVLIWSLVPRRDRFIPPGPVLEPSGHPRLFAEIEGLARALKEPAPLEVYLVQDLTAWVAERGGVMGFGSRRVMGLGLPLMQILTVSQFRAVLAHEFGHYYGGDTRLGPWVYQARAVMVRMISGLREDSWAAEIMHRAVVARVTLDLVRLMMELYWRLFLRATQLVSRRQERRADELACHLAGSKAFMDGLCRTHRAAPGFNAYWSEEVLPILNMGRHAPIAEGFTRFLEAPHIAEDLAALLNRELRDGRVSPYDTHPPLNERIAAVKSLPAGEQAADERPAISLIEDVPQMERRLLEHMNPGEAPKLEPTRWDQIAETVYIPMWTGFVREHAGLVEGIRAQFLPEAAQRVGKMGSSIRDPKGRLLSPEQRARRAGGLLVAAFALALHNDGWEACVEPGAFHMQRAEKRIEPAKVINGLIAGSIPAEAWRDECRSLGISDLRLNSREENRVNPSAGSASAGPSA